jgi:hypothetical protein
MAEPLASRRALPPRPSASLQPATTQTSSGRTEPLSPGRAPLVRKPRPDAGPLRIALGLTAVATTSAVITALMGPTVGTASTGSSGIVETVADPAPAAIKHVTRYVRLAPGQTAPPQAVVKQQPAPKPRVVVVTTKQSGKP